MEPWVHKNSTAKVAITAIRAAKRHKPYFFICMPPWCKKRRRVCKHTVWKDYCQVSSGTALTT